MFSTAKLAMGGIILAMIISAFWYVSGLRADLERSQQNVSTLKDSVDQQTEVITRMQEDQRAIAESREEIRDLVTSQRDEIEGLRSRFTESADGSARDIGKLGNAKPGLVENIVNNASSNAIRCLEIASGTELTEEELNEGRNSECTFDTSP
jgi:hypothetical protein